MNKGNFYKYAAFILLLINVAGLTFFLSKRPHRPQDDRSGKHINIATEELQLNEKQAAEFSKLVSLHRAQMDSLNQAEKMLLRSYFRNIHSGGDTNILRTIEPKFGEFASLKLVITKGHFQDVKSLLNEDQFPLYDDFIKSATTHIFSGRRPKKHQR